MVGSCSCLSSPRRFYWKGTAPPQRAKRPPLVTSLAYIVPPPTAPLPTSLAPFSVNCACCTRNCCICLHLLLVVDRHHRSNRTSLTLPSIPVASCSNCALLRQVHREPRARKRESRESRLPKNKIIATSGDRIVVIASTGRI